MARGQPVAKDIRKQMLKRAQRNALFPANLLRKIAKKLDIEAPTSITDLTLEQRKEAVQFLRDMKEGRLTTTLAPDSHKGQEAEIAR